MATATLTRPPHEPACGLVIGVDTHKDNHVAVALADSGARQDQCTVPAHRQGYSSLLEWALRLGSRPTFALEGTGSYGAGLARFLQRRGIAVVEVNRPDRSARRRLGKDDAIDAEMAARSFLAGTATAVPKAGNEKVEMIRLLKCAKDSASAGRTQALNQIRAILVTAPSSLRERLESLPGKDLVAACAALRPGLLTTPLAAAKRALRTLAKRVLALEEEMAGILADLDHLTAVVSPSLRASIGIGVDTAAVLLSVAGDNPERIRSERAFAAICGVSPLPASSGRTHRHRLNRGGNRQANAALHRIAVTRLRWHEPTRRYAARRQAEGLSKREILRCLKRFIAREVFHTIRGRAAIRLCKGERRDVARLLPAASELPTKPTSRWG